MLSSSQDKEKALIFMGRWSSAIDMPKGISLKLNIRFRDWPKVLETNH